MSNWFKQRNFDLKKLSITLLTPLPVDVSGGLVLSGNFFELTKVVPSLVNYKVGLGGETLVSESFNDVHILTLTYLASAPIVFTLDALKKVKTQFGILIQNNSAPRYKGIASECRFIEKPSIKLGQKGFEDFVYKILMTDYNEVFLTSPRL